MATNTTGSTPSSRHSIISIPALVPNAGALSNLLLSPKKRAANPSRRFCSARGAYILPLWGLLITGFGLLSMYLFLTRVHLDVNCARTSDKSSDRYIPDKSPIPLTSGLFNEDKWVLSSSSRSSVPSNLTEEEREFWEQPENGGYVPCLEFSGRYQRDSVAIVQDRKFYLVVVVSGGLNQQRNQIIDAVVIARILGASLVVPIMQVNVIWGDDSEFSDIFDVDHFKRTLKDDVRIVSSLPSTHIMTRPAEEKRTPLNATPEWLKRRYGKKLRKEGVLLLRGLDSRLSKDLPADLQKLRCKVAFQALRFAAPIQELGDKISRRIHDHGPYLALHLRLEKDVWVRTGCLTGLGSEFDERIKLERRLNPGLLTGRSNMTQEERQLAGLCPLTGKEVVRLLKGLGATSRTMIYWAGGEPFGGMKALEPLHREFPHMYNKQDLATPEELQTLDNKASRLAGVDYLVSLNSDVFLPSHGGNMGHALKGHRAYTGHRKHITPNKREMIPYFLNSSVTEEEFNRGIKEMHIESMGQPAMWTDKKGRDVLGYPVSDCMCKAAS